MRKVVPKRGECWWVSLDPTIGNEMKKTRPAVVVSIDHANKVLNRVTVIPLTSTVSPLFPTETLVTLKTGVSKAVVSQIRSVSMTRLQKRISAPIAEKELRAIEAGIRIHLGL